MSSLPSPKTDLIAPYREAFNNAAKAADVDALVSLVEDNVVAMSPNDTTVYGKDEYRAWWEEYFQYFRLVAFSEPERSVVVNVDTAIEVSGYMIAVAPANGESRIRDDGRTVTLWRRQPDDTWRIWQMIWNSTKPI